MNITKGKLAEPVRAVIYGPAGIGKTTLAAGLPDALFLDCEGGTSHLAVDRIRISTASDIFDAVKELKGGSKYKTIVVDTIDWCETKILKKMLSETHQKSIEDYGYGKGYTMLTERIQTLLDAFDSLATDGKNIVLLAHAKIEKQTPPDNLNGWDAWTLKLTRQTAPLIKEWASLILFANFQVTTLKEKETKKNKGIDQERIMFAQPSAAWTAKTRYPLPESMPLEASYLLPIFGGKTEPKTEPETEAIEPTAEENPWKWAEPHRAAITRYLTENKKWLQDGQTLEDLPTEKAKICAENKERLITTANKI